MVENGTAATTSVETIRIGRKAEGSRRRTASS
jgi:hypothetical protein